MKSKLKESGMNTIIKLGIGILCVFTLSYATLGITHTNANDEYLSQLLRRSIDGFRAQNPPKCHSGWIVDAINSSSPLPLNRY